jgi:hypothetical protein
LIRAGSEKSAQSADRLLFLLVDPTQIAMRRR